MSVYTRYPPELDPTDRVSPLPFVFASLHNVRLNYKRGNGMRMAGLGCKVKVIVLKQVHELCGCEDEIDIARPSGFHLEIFSRRLELLVETRHDGNVVHVTGLSIECAGEVMLCQDA